MKAKEVGNWTKGSIPIGEGGRARGCRGDSGEGLDWGAGDEHASGVTQGDLGFG